MLFGAYCEVHDEPEIANTMMPHTHEAIAMGPTGNLQGSYKFLWTEKNVRHNWTELSMPSSVLKKVNKIGADDKNQTLKFFDDQEMEYDFFEEDVQPNTGTDEEEGSNSMNLPCIELDENNDIDHGENFDVDDMSEMARQSESNADIVITGSEYVQQDLSTEMDIEEP